MSAQRKDPMVFFPYRLALAALGVILLFSPLSPCSAGDSGGLEAAPWPTAVAPSSQVLPNINLSGSTDGITAENFAMLPKLAEEGYPLAAVMLARYSQYELEDTAQTMRWLRVAVKNGDVGSAMALGSLYFPLEGTLGREQFAHKPDAVLGYAWYAIGLSGIKTLEKDDGEERSDRRHAQDTVEELRKVLLPSERARAAAILAAWPENLPPDAPLEPMPGKDNGDANAQKTKVASEVLHEGDIVENLRRWIFGDARNGPVIAAFFWPSPETEPVLRKAFDQMRRQADAGDEAAALMVAWCRFRGLGTEADEAGGPAPCPSSRRGPTPAFRRRASCRRRGRLNGAAGRSRHCPWLSGRPKRVMYPP